MQRRAHESTSGVPVQWPVSVVQKPLGLRQSEKIPSKNFRVQRLEMAKQMKMMNNTMSVFMAFMCFITPVGLGIYLIAGAVCRIAQQFLINKHMEKVNLDDIIAKNQEKAKKKREKMGIAENQINNAARMSTRRNTTLSTLTEEEKEEKRNKLFAYLCCIKYILDIISPNNDFHKNLKGLIAEGGKLLSLKDMGFPENWNYLGVWRG